MGESGHCRFLQDNQVGASAKENLGEAQRSQRLGHDSLYGEASGCHWQRDSSEASLAPDPGMIRQSGH